MAGKAVIFSAPSGSGKTTIVRYLLDKFQELQFSISATTRVARGYEVDGRDYYFLSWEVFESKIQNEEFLEWEEVYAGVKYGTLKSEVTRIWNRKQSVIFDVDVEGGARLKRKLGSSALAIFVKVPDMETLRNRLKSRRTESDESLEARVAKASQEMSYESKFDVTIINDNLDDALAEAESIVGKFLAK